MRRSGAAACPANEAAVRGPGSICLLFEWLEYTTKTLHVYARSSFYPGWQAASPGPALSRRVGRSVAGTTGCAVTTGRAALFILRMGLGDIVFQFGVDVLFFDAAGLFHQFLVMILQP